MSVPEALIAGRYRLVSRVGSGGMGVVWEAWDERLERRVALKQLRPQVGLSEEEAELTKNRAMREARITARLHHRHAVPVFDVVEHEGQPCLIMQFVPSVPLSTVLRDGGALRPAEAARVGGQIASALAAAHALGIVHRDVKPGNILIADDDTAMISDFGISHALGDATLTSTGMLHGTPAYLSPEVARGGESSSASDVFSLGATLYAAMEGGPPFGTDQNSIALLYRVAAGEVSPPVRSGEVGPLVMRMLAPEPEARPAMKDAAAELSALAARGGSDPTVRRAAEPPTVALPPTAVADSGPAPTTQFPSSELPAASLPSRQGPSGQFPPGQPPSTQVPSTQVPSTPFQDDEPRGAAAGAPAVRPSAPRSEPRRRRGLVGLLLAVVLVAGLSLAAAALISSQLGTAADPPAGGAETSAAPRAPSSAAPSDDEESSSAPAPTPSRATPTPSPTTTPSPRRTPTPTPTPTPSRSTAGDPSADQLAQAIRTYYDLVPDDTDEAWGLLTSGYQSGTTGGRQSYERFWDAIDEVSVRDVRGTAPDRAEATVTYEYESGRVVRERTSYRLVQEQGLLKIGASRVVSSTG